VRGGSLNDIRQRTSGASERSLAGFYSALALSNVEHFSGTDIIGDRDGEDDEPAELNPALNRLQWQWLAYAFWSRVAFNDSHVDIKVPSLTADDVSAVQTVLQNAYPEIVLDSPAPPDFCFVVGTKGTRI
jgi:hypothetical protein